MAALRNDDLETAEGFVLVDQWKAQQRAAGHRLAVRPFGHPTRDAGREPRKQRFVLGTGDGDKPGAVRRAQPKAAAAQRETPAQHADDPRQPLVGRRAGGQHFSDFGEDLETRMVRGQRRRDHKVANLGMPLPARQRRLTTEREQTTQNRLPAAEEGGGADHNAEVRGAAAAHAERR